LLSWSFRVSFCTNEGTLPYRSLDQNPRTFLVLKLDFGLKRSIIDNKFHHD
jgi:hypothetical protein